MATQQSKCLDCAPLSYRWAVAVVRKTSDSQNIRYTGGFLACETPVQLKDLTAALLNMPRQLLKTPTEMAPSPRLGRRLELSIPMPGGLAPLNP